jgi:hypothetical protein
MASVAGAQLTIVDNLPGAWIDVSGTGTPLNLSDDGEVDISTTVGNSLLAAGVARVGSNGAVRFGGTGQSLSYSNQPIPSTSLFGGDQSLAVFWDDFNTASGTNGNIYWDEVGGTLVIQWQDAGFFGSSDTATLQMQIHSAGPYAQFIYQDVGQPRPNNGGSATIGYQAGGIENDVQWSYNTAGAVQDGTVLSLIPEPASLALLALGALALRRR